MRSVQSRRQPLRRSIRRRRRRKNWKDSRLRPARKAGYRQAAGSVSSGIVKNYPERMPPAGTQAADTVTQVDPIDATRAAYRTMVHGKDHRIALTQGHDLGA